MSTNKTQNYHLHSWEKGDKFLMDEVNDNFTTLDAKLHEEVTTLDGQIKAEAAARASALAAKADTDTLTAARTALESSIKDLDGRKPQILTGSYVGNDRVELGVKPLAVIVMIARGNMGSSTNWYGMAFWDNPLGSALVLDETGFTPDWDGGLHIHLGFASHPYHYVAFY